MQQLLLYPAVQGPPPFELLDSSFEPSGDPSWQQPLSLPADPGLDHDYPAPAQRFFWLQLTDETYNPAGGAELMDWAPPLNRPLDPLTTPQLPPEAQTFEVLRWVDSQLHDRHITWMPPLSLESDHAPPAYVGDEQAAFLSLLLNDDIAGIESGNQAPSPSTIVEFREQTLYRSEHAPPPYFGEEIVYPDKFWQNWPTPPPEVNDAYRLPAWQAPPVEFGEQFVPVSSYAREFIVPPPEEDHAYRDPAAFFDPYPIPDPDLLPTRIPWFEPFGMQVTRPEVHVSELPFTFWWDGDRESMVYLTHWYPGFTDPEIVPEETQAEKPSSFWWDGDRAEDVTDLKWFRLFDQPHLPEPDSSSPRPFLFFPGDTDRNEQIDVSKFHQPLSVPVEAEYVEQFEFMHRYPEDGLDVPGVTAVYWLRGLDQPQENAIGEAGTRRDNPQGTWIENHQLTLEENFEAIIRPCPQPRLRPDQEQLQRRFPDQSQSLTARVNPEDELRRRGPDCTDAG